MGCCCSFLKRKKFPNLDDDDSTGGSPNQTPPPYRPPTPYPLRVKPLIPSITSPTPLIKKPPSPLQDILRRHRFLRKLKTENSQSVHL